MMISGAIVRINMFFKLSTHYSPFSTSMVFRRVVVARPAPSTEAALQGAVAKFGDDATEKKLESISGWWFGCHFLFSHISGIIIPIDELIFFRGVAQPPTRK